MRHYGLIGMPLAHSFSQKFFTEKFAREQHDAVYRLYPLRAIDELPQLVKTEHLDGLNVTMPYKQSVLPYLTHLADEAREIGAVNTIQIVDNQLIGYNTDCAGFARSIAPFLPSPPMQALILGTGGAARCVAYVLARRGHRCLFVSRKNQDNQTLVYQQVTDDILRRSALIVNATPLGMFPHADTLPPLPYHALTPQHILFDCVYNPEKTQFLQQGEKHGCTTLNGLKMLHEQAQESWKIWNGKVPQQSTC